MERDSSFDLILMSTRGVGLFRRLLLGSVAAKMLYEARRDQFRLEAPARMVATQQSGVVAPMRVAVGDIVAAVAEDGSQEDADMVGIGRGNAADSVGAWRTHAYGISWRALTRRPAPERLQRHASLAAQVVP